MIDHNRAFWALLAAALAAALSLAVAGASAYAHDWYPLECCHSQDCAPVTSTAFVAGAAFDATGKAVKNPMPQLVVTTRIGTAIVPSDLPRRESKDNQMHACIRNTSMGPWVMCIFVPPAM